MNRQQKRADRIDYINIRNQLHRKVHGYPISCSISGAAIYYRPSVAQQVESRINSLHGNYLNEEIWTVY